MQDHPRLSIIEAFAIILCIAAVVFLLWGPLPPRCDGKLGWVSRARRFVGTEQEPPAPAYPSGHTDGCNVIYFDGHVEFLPDEGIEDTSDDDEDTPDTATTGSGEP